MLQWFATHLSLADVIWVSVFAIAFSMYICLFPDIARQWNKVMESKTGDEEVRTVLCVPPSLHSTQWERGRAKGRQCCDLSWKETRLTPPPTHAGASQESPELAGSMTDDVGKDSFNWNKRQCLLDASIYRLGKYVHPFIAVLESSQDRYYEHTNIRLAFMCWLGASSVSF